MGKSAAERQRERRDRLKANERQYAEYKRLDRERKATLRKGMTEKQLNSLRRRVRYAVNKHRHPDESVDIDENYQYKTPASLGKAKSRVLKALRRSPRKRACVIKTLACEILDAYVISPPKNKIPTDVVNMVTVFFENDSISRMTPGKAEVVSITDSTGTRIQKQRRHLVMTLAEVYKCFKEENPDVDIRKSKFCSLRPKWVFLSSQMPHNVCGCRYHNNVILLLEALHRRYPETVPLYSRDAFTATSVCDLENEACMSNNCNRCSDAKLLIENYRNKVDEGSLKWYQWVDDENSIRKIAKNGSTNDAFDELERQVPKFFWHSFIKEKQAKACELSKNKSTESESKSCLLQMDFAENFTCKWQDEIQSAHWKQNQVTVYTVMVYHRQRKMSYVIVSDYRQHEKYAVAAFTSKILDIIKTELPDVEYVDIWTDGPSSQYKNKFIFVLMDQLQAKHNLTIQWNYFATSHGKGPNDALGGNVKRIAHRMTMTRRSIVEDAISFALAVRSSDTNIEVIVMDEGDIKSMCENIGVGAVWDDLQTFQGTSTTHFVKPVSKSIIEIKFYSSATESKRVSARYSRPADVGGNSGQDLVETRDQPLGQQDAVTPDANIPSVLQETLSNTEVRMPSKKRVKMHKPEPTPSTSSTNRRKKTKPVRNDPSNLCGHCSANYYDDDPADGEPWVQCPLCDTWFHMTCAGVYGKNYEEFVCDECLL